MKMYILCLFLLTTSLYAGSISIELENDVLFNSDKNYTHGTRISYQEDQRIYSIGQNMYTPSDITITTPIPDERPYAGILYGAINYIETFYEIETAVGVAGKYSYAEDTQKMIHGWIESKEPMGWAYQTDDQLLLQLDGRLYTDFIENNYFNARLYGTADLGTIFCNIGAGINIIAGYNIPKLFNKPIISKRSDYSFYIFTDTYDRHIFWNNTLKSDYTRVKALDNVLDVRYGLGMKYKHFELKYSTCDRSKEYTGQKDHAQFGTVMIKFNYSFPNKF